MSAVGLWSTYLFALCLNLVVLLDAAVNWQRTTGRWIVFLIWSVQINVIIGVLIARVVS